MIYFGGWSGVVGGGSGGVPLPFFPNETLPVTQPLMRLTITVSARNATTPIMTPMSRLRIAQIRNDMVAIDLPSAITTFSTAPAATTAAAVVLSDSLVHFRKPKPNATHTMKIKTSAA